MRPRPLRRLDHYDVGALVAFAEIMVHGALAFSPLLER
jgi:hypothetical protein